ncbi:MAG: leucine--tRNA ligase [Patescibacteria group bacterium]
MYDHKKIEEKWQKKWAGSKIYSPDLDKAKKPFYNLMMFPYPSAEGLHVGNMYAFVHSDCLGRFKRLEGYDVFEPMGLDGFGIHSENYAIKIGEHIRDVSRRTEKHFYQQLHMIGNQYDWTRTVETYKEDYYKWTQWLFLKMHKKGLAYRKKAPVNWCLSCKTVLSDEQVISGKCERCGTQVVKKQMAQWFFGITKYAKRLLKNLNWIDWTEEVKLGQKNWIGQSQGALIDFPVLESKKKIRVFTTRPDTVFGATYLVLAPEMAEELDLSRVSNQAQVKKYISRSKKKTEQQRLEEKREKTGVELRGLQAVNPLNNEKIPVWIADYALKEYGTGAIMAVPAHDGRDIEFAKKYGLEIKCVVDPSEYRLVAKVPSEDFQEIVEEILKGKKCYEYKGRAINSGLINGLETKQAIRKIIKYLEKNKLGRRATTYKLRDWCVSRQRYWGPPIPMIECEECGWVPVKEKDLPVRLPDMDSFHPDGSGKGPLNKVADFVKTKCPKCGGAARRETDVSDPFVDSSWYFFRYLNTNDDKQPLNKSRMKKWMPVDLYFGGKEHAVLHLLYARFVTMVLKDLGYIDFEEPFSKFFGHGLIVKDGAKMSKSKGNIVNPDEYIERFGADSVRLYLMFLGDARQGGDWKDAGMAGMFRFVKRLWRLYENDVNALSLTRKKIKGAEKGDLEKTGIRKLHSTIKKVTRDLNRMSFNTAIARIMELVNWLGREKSNLSPDFNNRARKILAVLISPFAPYLGEEFWQKTGGRESVFKEKWPEFKEELARKKEIELVIQVNGKLRLKILTGVNITAQEARKKALEQERIKELIADKKIKKVIFVKGRLINIVI